VVAELRRLHMTDWIICYPIHTCVTLHIFFQSKQSWLHGNDDDDDHYDIQYQNSMSGLTLLLYLALPAASVLVGVVVASHHALQAWTFCFRSICCSTSRQTPVQTSVKLVQHRGKHDNRYEEEKEEEKEEESFSLWVEGDLEYYDGILSRAYYYDHKLDDEVDLILASAAMAFASIPCVYTFLKFMLETRPEEQALIGANLVMHVQAGPEPPDTLLCCLTLDLFRDPVRSK
jgi:hypothetical protein